MLTVAPEIIEMTGQQSAAVDVWSVGCTVVELLTGRPPYFDMQQMPAMFRIVHDDHPPLPPNISPVSARDATPSSVSLSLCLSWHLVSLPFSDLTACARLLPCSIEPPLHSPVG